WSMWAMIEKLRMDCCGVGIDGGGSGTRCSLAAACSPLGLLPRRRGGGVAANASRRAGPADLPPGGSGCALSPALTRQQMAVLPQHQVDPLADVHGHRNLGALVQQAMALALLRRHVDRRRYFLARHGYAGELREAGAKWSWRDAPSGVNLQYVNIPTDS